MKTTKILLKKISLLLVLICTVGCDCFLGHPEEELRTYVPDDQFEQNLIDEGLDDVLDDYVLTDNIENVTVLELYANFDDMGRSHEPILDYTGLEDFASLQELTLSSMAESLTNDIIDLSENVDLRKLVFYQTDYDGINLSGNQLLEEIEFRGTDEGGYFPCRISNLDLRPNANVKKMNFYLVNDFDEINFNSILENVPSLEEFIFTENPQDINLVFELSFVNNPNLRTLRFGGDCLNLEVIDVKNGANATLESLVLSALCFGRFNESVICIEADDPTYISSITTANDMNGPVDFTVTDDCGS